MAKFIEDRSSLKKKKKKETTAKKVAAPSSANKKQVSNVANQVVNRTANAAKRTTGTVGNSAQRQNTVRRNVQTAVSRNAPQRYNNRPSGSAQPSTNHTVQDRLAASRQRREQAEADIKRRRQESEARSQRISQSRNPRMQDTQRGVKMQAEEERRQRQDRLRQAQEQKMGKNSMASKEVQRTANRAVRNTPTVAKESAKQVAIGHGKTFADITEASQSASIGSKIDIKSKEFQEDIEKRRKESTRVAKSSFKTLSDMQEKSEAKMEKVTKDAKGLEKAYYGALESGVGMATDRLTGPAWAVSMLSRTYGNTRGQAQKEGATEDEDRAYSLLQAAKEVATEYMFQGVGLAKGLSGRHSLSLGEMAANALTKNMRGPLANATHAGIRLLGGVGEENAEEAIGWGLDPFIKEFTYGRNVRTRQAQQMMREQSDALRSNITSMDDARAIAAYLGSDDFLDSQIRTYMDSGIGKEEARDLAENMRDYLDASLSGDTEKMADIEESLSKKLSGRGVKDILKQDLSLSELKDTIASTTLLTATTGLPGTVTTTARGAAIKEQLGTDGIRALAKTAEDFEDGEMQLKAKAMSERLDAGKDITNTQAYDLAVGVQEQYNKDADRQQTAYQTAQKTIKSEKLVTPYRVSRDGDIQMDEVTDKTYQSTAKSAKSAIETFIENSDGKESLTDTEIDRGSRAIAGFKTGVFTVDDANELNFRNTAVRSAFEKETGVDLGEYVVKGKDGQIDIPATNTATKNALFAKAADNLVATAQAETANWVDNTKGEVVTQISRRMGASGTAALQTALDDVDERDRSSYMMTANASDVLYQSARNMGTEWENAKDYAKRMFPNVAEDKLKAMYEAGLADRDMATDEARGQQIKIGEKVELKKQSDVPTGQVIIETSAPVKGSVIRTFTELARNLGVDIHLVDHFTDKNGKVLKNVNGEYIDGNIFINVNSDFEKNMGFIFMHEVTHHLKMYAPEQYKALENLVREKWFKYDSAQMQSEIAKKIETYAKHGQTLTEEQALEEIIADAAHEFLTDRNFAREVANEDASLAQAVLTSIRNALRMLRRIMSADGLDETHMNTLFSQLDILDEAERLWLDAYKQAVRNNAAVAVDRLQNQIYEEGRQSISETSDADYMDAVNRGDMETARRMVEQKAAESGFANAVPEQTLSYKTRVGKPPQKTKKVYKVFTVDEQGRPSALFVSGVDPLPQNVWLDAQDTWHFKNTRNGKFYVPSTKNPNTEGGKTGGLVNRAEISDEDWNELVERGFVKEGSKSVTALAYRPGWHAGDIPFFPQGGTKVEGSNYENIHRFNQVVFECEMAFDVDYTKTHLNKQGQVAFEDMQEMPENGGYEFATNPMAHAEDIGKWFISSSLKIGRALTEEECNDILESHGRLPQEWQASEYKEKGKGKNKSTKLVGIEKTIGPLNLEALGYTGEQFDAARKTLAPVTYDDNGDVIPLSERFNQSNPDIRYSISDETIEDLNSDGIDITESGTAVKYSLTSWEDTDTDALLEKLMAAGYDRERASKWIKDVNSIAALIAGDMGRLNYEADQFQDALKPNSEYYYTLDLSTLCQKRRLYQGTYNKIMHKLINNVLMPEDTIRLRQMMDEMGHQVPCGICYEESRKKNEGKFAERWLNGYGKRWKGYKNQEHTDPYIPTLNEVTTTDGREKLRREHPEAYESYVQYQKTRGSANPKISYTHTDYRGDILRMTDSDIEKVKHIGGLRIQSFSDFEVPHVIDMMQAVLDMAAKNLTAQAYTKVPAFADIFGGTGIKINLSLIQKMDENGEPAYEDYIDEDGNQKRRLLFDAKEGIDPKEAVRIREKYSKNVGTILVGVSRQQILDAWADDRVDMVIPFHRSGWGKKEFEKLGLNGYKDFTKGQTERYMMGKKDMALSTASKALGLTGDQKLQGIYAEDYWDYNKSGKENAEAYLALCAEKHYRPVFYQFLHDNGDGTWSLQEDGSTDGYWKSLIDFKMYDNDGVGAKQELVEANFDMDAAQKIMSEYEGGADTLPVADDVVEAFVKEYKEAHPDAEIADARLSISADLDEPYMAAVNAGNMEEAQKYVDEAAKRAGYNTPRLYHGTPSFGFTTFDLGRGENIIFATSNPLTAETYSGETDRRNISDAASLNVDDLYGESLLKEASKYRKKYKDYRLMAPAEQEQLLDESRKGVESFARVASDFIDEHRDAFNAEKLEIANRIVNALDRVSTAWTDDMVDSAWNDYEDAVWDLKWMDESIQMELAQALQNNGSLLYAKNRVSDFMYAGDIYRNKNYESDYVFDNQLALELDADLHKGIYGLYGKGDNQLVIDANGSNWNQITPPDELNLYGPQRTRSIAEAAKAKGYDSVLFKNLKDNGGGTPYNGISDVYMFFNPSQVKSADPVTYAEDGSVIPLSERFDPTNNDIRYSMSTEDADGNVLTTNQMEYFRNSQARDENGRLVPVYHATRTAGFTVFDPTMAFDEVSISFTNDIDFALNYASEDGDIDDFQEAYENRYGMEEVYSDLDHEVVGHYKVYLNMENPLVLEGDYLDEMSIYEWPVYAKDNGYDGVIYRDFDDIGSDIYQVFSRSQIKDTRNENPTENPDIRYSITEDEGKSKKDYDHATDMSYEELLMYEDMISNASESYDIESAFGKAFDGEKVSKFYSALTEEVGMVFDDEILEEGRMRMAKSKADFWSNLNTKWQERWVTKGEVLDTKSVKTNVRNLIRGVMNNSDTDRQYKTELVNKTLMDMRVAYQLMKQDRTDIASALLYHSALRMITDVDFIQDDTEYQEYKGIRDYLRGEPITVGEDYWQSKAFQQFRKEHYGILKLRKGANGNIGEVYAQLENLYPHIFSETERSKNGFKDDEEDLLQYIGFVTEQNMQPFMEAYSSEYCADWAFEIADDLYEIMENGEGVTSLADRYKAKYDAKAKAMKTRHAEAILRVRKQKQAAIDALKDRYNERLDKQRELAKDAIRREREKFRQQKQAEKERTKERKLHSKYFDSIVKSHKTLSDRLLTNTKDKHIPEQYKKDLAELLAAFDLQTVASKKLEIRNGLYYRQNYQSQKTIRMKALQETLANIQADSQLFYVNDSITEIIDRLLGKNAEGKTDPLKSVEGRTIDELTSSELKDIDKLLKALIHEFNNYESVRVGAKRQQAADIGTAQIDSCLEHAGKFGEGLDYQNFLGALDNIIGLDEVTPAYMFRQIDPQNNGIGMMFKELRRSFGKYVRNQNQLNEWMENIIGEYNSKGRLWKKYGSALEEWRVSTRAKEFQLTNGNVKLTPAQMMSIYCLSHRQQAYDHMTGAGIVVQPVSFQAKMASDLRKRANYALPVVLTDSDIKLITSRLTPDQIKVADKLQELMATKMAEWGNEASMSVMGIRLFEDPDYFPIKSDKAALEKDFSAEQFMDCIRNFGFTKAVQPGARNAIAIGDIFDVVAEHCNNMNLYNAYSESMNDFMKVYNYHAMREDGSDYSVEQAIAHAYSKKATTFIRSFMKDLNGNVSRERTTGIEQMMNDSLGKAKKASVFANGRVALQQPTALMRAFAVINPKYLKGVKAGKATMQEMFEHSPIALWKSWGYYDINMGKSIEDLMMNNGSWAEDKMTDIYGKLDNRTWAVIWTMCKNEIEDKHKDVEKGSDEYWELVSERFDEVVDLTQVVDSPFHRSHAMRSKNTLTKMATAFMAEPTLTFNMVRDGFRRAKEELRLGNKKAAGKIVGRTVAVFVFSAWATAAAAAIWDAVRGKTPGGDDDDEQGFFDMWFNNMIENLKDNLNLLNNIYYVKDVVSLFQGWDNKNLGLQGWKHFADAYGQLKGEKVDSKLTWYENMLAGVGYLTGKPYKTMMNDGKAIFKMFGLSAPGFVTDQLDKLDSIGSSTRDMNRGSSSSSGVGSTSTNEKSSAVNLWTYDNAPFRIDNGSPADNFLNFFGINLTKSEIAAAEARQAEKEHERNVKKIKNSLSKYSGTEYDEHLWDRSELNGYGKALSDGDFARAEEIERLFIDCGGSQSFLDEKKLYHYNKKYVKTIVYDPTDEQIEQQAEMKEFLLSHGVTQAELSAKVYKSQTAKEAKVAFRLNDEDAIVEELTPLIRAGLTLEDCHKLYDNRNGIDLMKYKNSGGKYSDRLKSTGTYKWPSNGTITSTFGHRSSPGGIGSTNHQGIDIGASMGAPVTASDGGVVIKAGWYGGYGKTVQIQHDDGTITQYSHLSWWEPHVGDVVAQGQEVGKVGSTGNSTGPHLHFGVLKNGNYVDPMDYLNKKS